jgi:hypothetical protein
MSPLVYYLAPGVLVLLLVCYVVGVRRGRNVERRAVTREFQEVLDRLLHHAAQRDYVNLHAFLNEVCSREQLSQTQLARAAQQHLNALDESLPRSEDHPEDLPPVGLHDLYAPSGYQRPVKRTTTLKAEADARPAEKKD